jgi:NAD(P)-dependent dehydrogenase (short-subunit alcohol dehydrogenase family)
MATRPEDMKDAIPTQRQHDQPGHEHKMEGAKPIVIRDTYKGADKLKGKVAIITGGDSGIGRAVAVHFAREGADVAITYLDEDRDAKETAEMVKKEGKRCLVLKLDVRKKSNCEELVQKTVQEFGRLDVLVNNAAIQHYKETIADITEEQLEDTFRTNIFGYFFMVQAALPHLKEGSSIINTTSVTAYKGSAGLVDYSSTKGSQVSFTRSLSQQLVSKGIRVNGVAPGPIYTPLIPATFPKEKFESWREQSPMKRPGQPAEVATSYVFLASEDASYFAGQVLHPNGGTIVNA